MRLEKKELLKKVIHALKSGKYEPFGSVNLSNEQKQMNALGVICDVYRKNTGKGEWQKSNWYPYPMGFETQSDYNVTNKLPGSVAYYFGLSSDPSVLYEVLNRDHKSLSRSYTTGGRWVKISFLSSKKVSHEDIAQYLEKTYLQ